MQGCCSPEGAPLYACVRPKAPLEDCLCSAGDLAGTSRRSGGSSRAVQIPAPGRDPAGRRCRAAGANAPCDQPPGARPPALASSFSPPPSLFWALISLSETRLSPPKGRSSAGRSASPNTADTPHLGATRLAVIAPKRQSGTAPSAHPAKLAVPRTHAPGQRPRKPSGAVC